MIYTEHRETLIQLFIRRTGACDKLAASMADLVLDDACRNFDDWRPDVIGFVQFCTRTATYRQIVTRWDNSVHALEAGAVLRAAEGCPDGEFDRRLAKEYTLAVLNSLYDDSEFDEPETDADFAD